MGERIYTTNDIEITPYGAMPPPDYECQIVKLMKHGGIKVKNEIDGKIFDWQPEEHYLPMLNTIYGIEHKRNIIVKSRRAFMTTHHMIAMFLLMLTRPFFSAYVINWQKNLGSSEIFDKMARVICESTDIFKDFEITKERAKYMHPEGGPCIADNASTIRSGGGEMGLFTDFGRMSAIRPNDAQEALAGSLEAANHGYNIIESTNAGPVGRFTEIAFEGYERQKWIQKARSEGKKARISRQEMLLWFHPWFKKVSNVEDLETREGRADCDPELREYFEKLEKSDGLLLTPEQKWWYEGRWTSASINKHFPAMFEEHPSTFDEVFTTEVSSFLLSNEIMRLRNSGNIGKYQYTGGMVYTAWDTGWSDKTVVLFCEKVGVRFRIFDFYVNSNQFMTHYIDILNRKGYSYAKHIFPHDANAVNTEANKKLNGDFKEKSTIDRMKLGGHSNTAIVPKMANNTDEQYFHITKEFMLKCEFDESGAGMVVKELQAARRAEVSGITVSKLHHSPHDESSHFYKAFEQLARYFEQENTNTSGFNRNNIVSGATGGNRIYF